MRVFDKGDKGQSRQQAEEWHDPAIMPDSPSANSVVNRGPHIARYRMGETDNDPTPLHDWKSHGPPISRFFQHRTWGQGDSGWA